MTDCLGHIPEFALCSARGRNALNNGHAGNPQKTARYGQRTKPMGWTPPQLHLAATTMESKVADALEMLLDDAQLPRFEQVREAVTSERIEHPAIKLKPVDLKAYDGLLKEVAA